MPGAGFEERAIVELHCPAPRVPPVVRVRGTLLASSLQGVRERGLQDTYFEALDSQHHDTIREMVAATWLPVEVAMAHYEAVDALGLSARAQWTMGRRVAERVQHGWAGTVVRALKASGAVTPLRVLGRFPSGWERLMDGGATAVYQTGPKDLRVEGHGVPMAPGTYFRNAFGGMFESTLELVARTVYVSELPRYRGPTTCAYSISWV